MNREMNHEEIIRGTLLLIAASLVKKLNKKETEEAIKAIRELTEQHVKLIEEER